MTCRIGGSVSGLLRGLMSGEHGACHSRTRALCATHGAHCFSASRTNPRNAAEAAYSVSDAGSCGEMRCWLAGNRNATCGVPANSCAMAVFRPGGRRRMQLASPQVSFQIRAAATQIAFFANIIFISSWTGASPSGHPSPATHSGPASRTPRDGLCHATTPS